MVAASALSGLNTLAKVGIGAVLTALIGIAYYVIFHADLSSQIQAAQREHGQLESELVKAQALERAYQKDLAELTDREQRLRDLNKILPATTEYPAFLSAVQNVANATGVSLTAWTPQEEVRETYFARVPMKVELKGRYHQIARFFYAVGQLDRIINMEDISLTDPTAVGDDVVLGAQALATAFHAVSEQAAAPELPSKRKRRQKRERKKQ